MSGNQVPTVHFHCKTGIDLFMFGEEDKINHDPCIILTVLC